MTTIPANALVQTIHTAAYRIEGTSNDYDPLMELIGDAPFVLLGEASHGTHDFYEARAKITKRLIEEQGFNAVAVEADWPDAYRVNRYVRGIGSDTNSDRALSGFRRFPAWMWRNTDIQEFVAWLRTHNGECKAEAHKVGFYGLDLYSLYASIDAVLHYLEKTDPEAAMRARYRYSCFDHFAEDAQAYGYAASFDLSASCEQQVISQVIELQKHPIAYARRQEPGRERPDGEPSGGVQHVESDELFFAQQNARLVKNAEEYYRTMFRGHVESWNRRDRHMAETLEALVTHLASRGRQPKIVVWAHNSHLGDARATELGDGGELNVGQLVRERYGAKAVLMGFTTYEGTVTAASDWDAAPECKRVRPALKGSYEAVFHDTGIARFLLLLRNDAPLHKALHEPRLERAIGVIYRPETERSSHYFNAQLSEQFDAVIHFDRTQAVQVLETIAEQGAEVAETFPSGI